MPFADNLKQIRKEKGLSQEALAELLGVSRQAISKWEQGNGYPETQKLLLLSSKLTISLDRLMDIEIDQEIDKKNVEKTGNITITSPFEHVIVTCYNVIASGRFNKRHKNSPHYALFAVSEGYSFWGQPTLFLGWYADEEHISKEIRAIKEAIAKGQANYNLKYCVKVQRRWLKMKMVK